MVGWYHQLDGHEFEQALGFDDEQGLCLMCCSPWGHKESDVTERLNWTDCIRHAGKLKHYGYRCLIFLIPPVVHNNNNDNTYSNTRASQVALVVKNPPANAGHIRDWDLTPQDSIPASGRSPGDGNGNLLQYSCLKNPHGQRSLAGYSPCGCRVGHNWSDFSTATHGFMYMYSQFSSVTDSGWHGAEGASWLEGSRLQQTRCHFWLPCLLRAVFSRFMW